MAGKLKSADNLTITYYDTGAAWVAGTPQIIYGQAPAPVAVDGQMSLHIQNRSADWIHIGTDNTVLFGHYIGANTGITYDISNEWAGLIYVVLAGAAIVNPVVTITQVASVG